MDSPKLEDVVGDAEYPDFDARVVLRGRCPGATISAYTALTRIALPRLLGLRSCARCPDCSRAGSSSPCQDKIGSNMRPLGGFAGCATTLAGATEFQREGAPHMHFHVNIVSTYQHSSMADIAESLEAGLLAMDDIKGIHEWISREEPV